MADSPKLPDVAAADSTPEGLDDFVAQLQGSTPNPGVSAAGSPSNPVSAPSGAPAAGLVPEGLDDFISEEMKEEKYGSTGQKVITGLEGAANAATFGLAAGIERGFGVKPEDMQARRETNPGTYMAGQAAGLIGSTLIPGVGAANVLTKAGQVGAKAIGLGAAETAMAKIGSMAVKGAIENMVFQGGDEIAKMIAQDPNQSVATAAADIGLSGIIGGGLSGAVGTINPLWKATMGTRVGGTLKAIANKVGGIEGVVPNAVEEAIETAGISVSPEIKAALSSDPMIQRHAQVLMDSASKSGIEMNVALKDFKNSLGESVLAAMGKTADDIGADLSEAEIGMRVKQSLKQSLKEQMDPISEQFAKVKDEFKSIELPKDSTRPTGKSGSFNPYEMTAPVAEMETVPGMATKLSDKLSEVAQKEGWLAVTDSAEMKIINKIQKDLPKLETLEDLRKYASNIGDETYRGQMWKLGREVKDIFRNAEDELVSAASAAKYADNPEIIEMHSQARNAYKNAMGTIEDLNDRLRVGRYNGPGSFIKALDDMSPEDILRRLSPKGDAAIIGELSTKFPMVAKEVQNYHLSAALKNAGMRAAKDETINTNALFKALDKMSPEMRAFLVSPEAATKIEAVKKLLEAMPEKIGRSGTPEGLSEVLANLTGSAVGVATAVVGNAPVLGVILGPLTKALGRDVPDAARLGLLKFLGADKPIETEGFKAMVDFIDHTIKGENRVLESTKNVFKTGKAVLPQFLMPTEHDRDRLEKRLKQLQENPSAMMDVGGKTSHYMPEVGLSMGETAANAVNYLNSIRPAGKRMSPLDPELPPSDVEKIAYNRALNIAQQPLSILEHVKKGTVQLEDMKALNVMYPALYKKLQKSLLLQMTEALNKKKPIPYETRLGLSLFMGQPLDSSMTPEAIQAAQPKPAPYGQQPQPGGQQMAKKSMTALNKLPGAYQTASQARQNAREGRDN
jgi:hypothetical protein